MKIKPIVLLTVWNAVLLTYGQSVPEMLNYQGRILNDDGPYSGETNVVVALYDSATAGTKLFTETHTVQAVKGFYSLQMGSVNTTGLATALDAPMVYLETTIGTNVLSPRERVLSVAYALQAKRAERADDYLPLSGGTLTGPLINNSTLHFQSWTNFICTGAGEGVDIGANAYSDYNTDVSIGDYAQAHSTSEGSVAIGANATARWRVGGVAIGKDADGDYNGVGIGYSANGQYTNVAIGFNASSRDGYDRIAIGSFVTNRKNCTSALKGNLYLDGTYPQDDDFGGSGRIFYRDRAGVTAGMADLDYTGKWRVKAFTIPHPLDQQNKVLRHYSLEGPVVWNVYAGNVELQSGRAEVELPDYYSALNLAGSEVYSLTAVGGPASLYVEREVAGNRFVIGGDTDVKVSWTIKVKRNDPGCLKGLEMEPVEQAADEIEGYQQWLKAQQY